MENIFALLCHFICLTKAVNLYVVRAWMLKITCCVFFSSCLCTKCSKFVVFLQKTPAKQAVKPATQKSAAKKAASSSSDSDSDDEAPAKVSFDFCSHFWSLVNLHFIIRPISRKLLQNQCWSQLHRLRRKRLLLAVTQIPMMRHRQRWDVSLVCLLIVHAWTFAYALRLYIVWLVEFF